MPLTCRKRTGLPLRSWMLSASAPRRSERGPQLDVSVHSVLTFLAAGLLALTCASLAAAQTPPAVDGILDVVWGDPTEDSPEPLRAQLALFVTDDDGQTTRLKTSPELVAANGGFLSWHGRRVRAFFRQDPAFVEDPFEPGRPIAALRLLGDEDGDPESRDGSSRAEDPEPLGGAVSGSQPWVSILCKFSNISAEPENLAFFNGMYANSPGGLDHYWREVSYDKIDVVGSVAIDWVDLPQSQTSYIPVPGSGSNANLSALFNDCTAAANPFVDFSDSGGGIPFVGINQMFNGNLDCCAWGGSRFATLDGLSKVWRTTWNPPWSFANEGVIAHEMGHGFGLPHANNWDGDSSPYDSPWDVMSSATGNAVNDPTYGQLGKHINAYHKNRLVWIDAPRKETVSPGQMETVTLDHLALQSATNTLLIEVPIEGSSTYYTIEARDRSGNYDGNLPGKAVIIHEVVSNRSEPSWAVDGDVPPANYGNNPGTMWVVGETYTDSANGISIIVQSETPDGFVVVVRNQFSMIFDDGFESGNTTSWQ